MADSRPHHVAESHHFAGPHMSHGARCSHVERGAAAGVWSVLSRYANVSASISVGRGFSDAIGRKTVCSAYAFLIRPQRFVIFPRRLKAVCGSLALLLAFVILL